MLSVFRHVFALMTAIAVTGVMGMQAVADLNLDAVLENGAHRAGDDVALLQLARRRRERVVLELLDAQGDALLVDVDVEPKYSELAADRIPDVQVEWVELGGHICALIDPDSDAIAARIVAFLQTHG